MRKIIISILLLLGLNLSADSMDNEATEYIKACDNGSIRGCATLGILYFTGNGVKANPKKAKELLNGACKKKHAGACFNLGTIYKRGADGVERNYRKSRLYYARGCRLGLAKSCDQYYLIKEKREIIGSNNNDNNFSYTYSPEIYGG